MTDTAAWTDREGRRWSTAITVATLKRVRELVDVNLLDVFDGALFPDLSGAAVVAALRVESFRMRFPVARVAG